MQYRCPSCSAERARETTDIVKTNRGRARQVIVYYKCGSRMILEQTAMSYEHEFDERCHAEKPVKP